MQPGENILIKLNDIYSNFSELNNFIRVKLLKNSLNLYYRKINILFILNLFILILIKILIK